jgi:hypothetical protein
MKDIFKPHPALEPKPEAPAEPPKEWFEFLDHCEITTGKGKNKKTIKIDEMVP